MSNDQINNLLQKTEAKTHPKSFITKVVKLGNTNKEAGMMESWNNGQTRKSGDSRQNSRGILKAEG
jgi:hypothetical protein